MSTFYIVLIVFLVIIGLLCLVSLCMYCCHICSGGNETFDDKQTLFARRKQYEPSNQKLLEEGNPSDIPKRIDDGIEMVSVKNRVGSYEQRSNPSSRKPSFSNRPQSQNNTQTPSSSNRVSANIRHHASSEDISTRKASVGKPPVPTRPMIHSLPASKRNSLTRPIDFPPKNSGSTGFIAPAIPSKAPVRQSSVVKPKAPPPPVPANNVQPPPPPTYNACYDKTPMEDYLSNN